MKTPLRVALLIIGTPIALVLFSIFMLVGLLVFGVPILLLTLLAASVSAVIATLASIVAFIHYFAREETHAPDPGNYSLKQTRSSDRKDHKQRTVRNDAKKR